MLRIFMAVLIATRCNTKCNTQTKYDYIIIGAGTAGSIVASQLSSNPDISVLLIEEGGWSSQWQTINDASRVLETWFEPQLSRGYLSEPQEHLNDRVLAIKRAKVTGGCNSHNFLQYVLGQRKDFDERWNINGWKWLDLEPIWHYINETFKHTVIDPEGVWTKTFIKTAEEIGYTFTSKPNDLSNIPTDPTWIKEAMGHIISGDFAQRETSWTAYIEPILASRANLDVLVYTRVNKILFKTSDKKGRKLSKPTANGVETFGIGDYKINTFHAKKEVILCGGAIDSPKILMLSGIGDCNYLKGFNIECIANVPAVGKNLQEHLLGFAFSPPLKDPNTEIPAKFGILYGVLTMRDEGRYHIGLDIIQTEDGKISIECLIGLFQLLSRGEILLNDANAASKPIIDLNAFSNAQDKAIWIDAVSECRQLLYSNTLKQFYNENEDEILPGRDVDTDEEILQFGRETMGLYNHLSGTCKMGNAFNDNNLNEIVTNNKLQLRGVKNLRIVDLSIAPIAPSGNTNQITMIIGFKGAQLILDDYC